jgi:hypothetical protein
MTLLSTLSQSLSHFQASIEGSSPYLSVYSYHSIVSLEEILAVVNQIVLSSFPRLLVPTAFTPNHQAQPCVTLHPAPSRLAAG